MDEIKERFWVFMGGIAKQNEIKPFRIGGFAGHVHLLLSLPTTMSVDNAIRLIKGGSSTRAHETLLPPAIYLAWLRAFTVCL